MPLHAKRAGGRGPLTEARPGALARTGAAGGAGRTGRLCLLLAGTAAMAAAAIAVRRQTERAEARHPPAGEFRSVAGVRLHYLERGEGQPLVLLHGAGSLTDDFVLSGLVEEAAKRYRVIVFDRPGYGYSERPRHVRWTPEVQADLLNKALHNLGAERPIILGHSWGTMVALAHALRHPEDTAGIVLLSGYLFPTARPDAAMLSLAAVPVIGDLLRHTVLPLSVKLLWPRILRKLFGPSPVPPAFHAFPAEMVSRPSQLRAAAEEFSELVPAAARLSRKYGEVTVPVAILAGTGDRICETERHSGQLYDALSPDTFYRLVPDAGHMIHHLVPHQVLALIDSVSKAAATGTVAQPRPHPPRHRDRKPGHAAPDDLVEENSEDSFPASDPPNYAAGVPGRPDGRS